MRLLCQRPRGPGRGGRPQALARELAPRCGQSFEEFGNMLSGSPQPSSASGRNSPQVHVPAQRRPFSQERRSSLTGLPARGRAGGRLSRQMQVLRASWQVGAALGDISLCGTSFPGTSRVPCLRPQGVAPASGCLVPGAQQGGRIWGRGAGCGPVARSSAHHRHFNPRCLRRPHGSDVHFDSEVSFCPRPTPRLRPAGKWGPLAATRPVPKG